MVPCSLSCLSLSSVPGPASGMQELVFEVDRAGLTVCLQVKACPL
jgi:hypothetical protein